MRIRSLSFFSLLAYLLLPNTSFSAPACRNVFDYNPAVAAIVDTDAVKQWLAWEQKSNYTFYVKSEAPLSIPVSKVDPSSVNTIVMNSAPSSIRTLIQNHGSINWFKHPYNKVSEMPHFSDPVSDNLVTYETASRSLAVILGKDVFTLKMPTDHPHGPFGEKQKSKATVKEDIQDGINRMVYIEKVDQEIGVDPQLILAKEVAMVSDKATGEGYLFRDISFMNDGNYYLPALSIPYAGRKIAEFNKMQPELFWKEHYAKLLGRAKAKLLLRYGLQMETPNSQNMLIQLDKNLKPTGVLVFRDISDTMLVRGVAKALGEEQTLRKDEALNVENTDGVAPYWKNSVWKFDQAGPDSLSRDLLEDWGRAHNQAFKKEIEKALGIDLSKFTISDSQISNPEFDAFMKSDFVQTRIREYRQKLKARNKSTKI